MDPITIGSWVLEIYICEPSLTLMHIHVFAKQMYKYTLWVSENWYPLRKIYYKCLSVRLGKEKFSCDICFYWHFSGAGALPGSAGLNSQPTELYIEVWDVCHAGGGRQGRGGRVASLARRNAWLEFQMDLSLSLSLSLSHSVVIVKRWVVTTLKSEDDQPNMKCNDCGQQ